MNYLCKTFARFFAPVGGSIQLRFLSFGTVVKMGG